MCIQKYNDAKCIEKKAVQQEATRGVSTQSILTNRRSSLLMQSSFKKPEAKIAAE